MTYSPQWWDPNAIRKTRSSSVAAAATTVTTAVTNTCRRQPRVRPTTKRIATASIGNAKGPAAKMRPAWECARGPHSSALRADQSKNSPTAQAAASDTTSHFATDSLDDLGPPVTAGSTVSVSRPSAAATAGVRPHQSSCVQADLEKVANEAFALAEHLLEKNGEFYPVGVTMDLDGEVALSAGDPGLGNTQTLTPCSESYGTEQGQSATNYVPSRSSRTFSSRAERGERRIWS
jgi:hypothetical protein